MPQTRLYTDAFSPDDALQLLKEGNFRFLNGMMQHRDLLQEVTHTQAAQRPFAAILSCMDSRTSGEFVFDQGLGDIFSIRIAGNIITSYVLGSLEYACALAGARLIVVMGHTNCGAIKGACEGVMLGNLSPLLAHIQPAISQVKRERKEDCSSHNPEFLDAVTRQHIQNALAQIQVGSPVLEQLIREGKLKLAGALYNVASGQVSWL